MPRSRPLVALLLAGVLAAPAAARAQGDPSPHRAARVVADGVGLEVLDWGGAGPALVFVPGFGNSAHVFDDFAPRFADRHRVVGVSRVGFGGSDQPERDGYALDARVAQLRAVLDSLGLRRAVLVGHSLGGDEITAFATRFPERTAGVVYLDAALDHVEAIAMEARLDSVLTGMPRPAARDRADAAGYRAYLRRAMGMEYPIGEVLATTRFDAAGAVLGRRTPGRVAEAIFAATRPLDFRGVRAPALALYAEWTPLTVMFPFLADDPAQRARVATVVDTVMRPWVARERARLAREVPHARVVSFPSHHYQFLSDAGETERPMRAFLAALPPAAP
ncbi:alpha/beta hydrolase [Roseisolibacter sp. H3M3-2]|uniref:alpha/beta fold hydrolase n=1 Tax=Roseisolibacter sp. H3M3-2 TaxID=3031323 RepID=UPI0023DA881F|nr:alpha/beta hydrolase [Roseisolibacter sp. H3M3-2]MDF1504977.1 alpha/beta hydrolase [Roseisolibacter sp. H3M3-2]